MPRKRRSLSAAVKAKVALDAHKGLKTVGALAKQHHRAAKALGRTVRNFDDKTWKANTRRFVTEGNVEKFKQNPEMLEFAFRVDCTSNSSQGVTWVRFIIALITVLTASASTIAQSVIEKAESEWNNKLETLNLEYFEKLNQLRLEHIQSLEALRKDATTGDRLDEAIKLRELIESQRTQLDIKQLPEDKSKFAKEKMRLANILKQSKWNCSENPHLPKWAGKHLVFHENGTIVPATDQNGKIEFSRWGIIDGKNVIGLLGDYLIVFRLNDAGNALDVFELGSGVDTTAKRASVQSPSLARLLREVDPNIRTMAASFLDRGNVAF